MEPKPLNLDKLKSFYPDAPRPTVGVTLASARSVISRQKRREHLEIKRQRAAKSAIERLPRKHESIHCVLRGDFALWDFVPLVHELAGATIERLTIATLGTSKRNVECLDQMIRAGQIQAAEVLVSHYFSAADQDVYQHLVGVAQQHGLTVGAMRSHAKLLLFAIGKLRIVVESSANLRSCHNVEQATMFDDQAIYDFHRTWITELLKQHTDART